MARDKVYDRHYFEHWYRRSGVGVGQREFVARKVRLAVSAAEYLLERPIERVLDVGCGEAPWRAILRRLRPQVSYEGMDSSTYAVRRYGRTRGIRLGRVGELAHAGFRGRYDLVVCSDVLHYVTDDEVRAGLHAMHDLCRGVAFLETFTSADAIAGDHDHLQPRSRERFLRWVTEVGFTPLGLHLYACERVAHNLVALERGGR
jgi:SAM-dependent methyltransferase